MPPGKGRRNLEAAPGPPDSVIAHTHHQADIHDTPVALLDHIALLYCTADLSIDSTICCACCGKAKQLLTLPSSGHHQPFFLQRALKQLCNVFNPD